MDTDHDASKTPLERLTVADAALLLGVSQDAVRKRIQRNTILWEKDDEGHVFVLLDASETSQPSDQDASKTALDILQDQVDYLKEVVRNREEELRRKDAILMTMAQRIPELEARETVSEDKSEERVQDDEERPSWWRRMFS
jgi:gas vesicle protein